MGWGHTGAPNRTCFCTIAGLFLHSTNTDGAPSTTRQPLSQDGSLLWGTAVHTPLSRLCPLPPSLELWLAIQVATNSPSKTPTCNGSQPRKLPAKTQRAEAQPCTFLIH